MVAMAKGVQLSEGRLMTDDGDVFLDLDALRGAAVALVQTYSTADATLAAWTPDTESVAYVGTDGAGSTALSVDDGNALRTAYENLRTAVVDLFGFVNALVDALQTLDAVD